MSLAFMLGSRGPRRPAVWASSHRLRAIGILCLSLHIAGCAVWPGAEVSALRPLPDGLEERGAPPEAPELRRVGGRFFVSRAYEFVLYERSLTVPPQERTILCPAQCEFLSPTSPGAYAYSVVDRGWDETGEYCSPRSAERYVTVE